MVKIVQKEPSKKRSSKSPKSIKKAQTKAQFAALKISHIPKHFEEPQLRRYFQQFGPVYGVFLARSNKVRRFFSLYS